MKIGRFGYSFINILLICFVCDFCQTIAKTKTETETEKMSKNYSDFASYSDDDFCDDNYEFEKKSQKHILTQKATDINCVNDISGVKKMKFKTDQQVVDFFSKKEYDIPYSNYMIAYLLSKNLDKKKLTTGLIIYGIGAVNWDEFFSNLTGTSGFHDPNLNKVKKFIVFLLAMNLYKEANEIIDWMNGDRKTLFDL